MAANSRHNDHDLFASLISDIKSYCGKDPLLPWLRGIKTMKDCLPTLVLKEKLPRFLQKCCRTFETDRRYGDDLRYLRIWLQLMDYVEDPSVLLRTMEENGIGMKRSLFYQAYALYYEKMKKFEEAEKMYRLGAQNLAEPLDELQKSYEQFLHRMERHKNKRIQRQGGKTARQPLSSRSFPLHSNRTGENDENTCNIDSRPNKVLDGSYWNMKPLVETNHVNAAANPCKIGTGCNLSAKEISAKIGPRGMSKQQVNDEKGLDKPTMFCSDDTIVVKFVDTAIVGKSEAEDACHHGLVDPTINMKEAMNAINSMFREPLETAPAGRRSHKSQPKEGHCLSNGFEVFTDENLDNEFNSPHQEELNGLSVMQHSRDTSYLPQQAQFEIYIDDEGSSEIGDRHDEKDYSDQSEVQNMPEGSVQAVSHLNAFVFPSPKDLSSESPDDLNAGNSPQAKIREDTVVRKFVGSTILDEPEVENVCHHGLVDPTINLKEAMADINNMFGKPIDFVRAKRPKQHDKAPVRKQDLGGVFSILPDDVLEHKQSQAAPKLSGKPRERDLFEPTVFTKEAMDEINKMFGMPLDF